MCFHPWIVGDAAVELTSLASGSGLVISVVTSQTMVVAAVVISAVLAKTTELLPEN